MPLARVVRQLGAATEVIEDTNRWLHHVVEQGPAAIVMTNQDGTIEYVNRKFSEITGYSREDVLGTNPRVLQSGLTPRATYDRLWRTLASGQEFEGEFQNRRKNGQVYWAEVLISPVKDVSGLTTRYVCVQTDITKHKAIENALRESNERLHQLSENLNEVFYVMDVQFRETLYINAAYETIWGRSRQSLYDDPKSFLDSVVPEDAPDLIENIARGQLGESAGDVEFRIVKPDGAVRWILSHAMPIRNAQGEVYRIAGIARDITDRRTSQDRLEEAMARYRRLAEASFDGIVITERGTILDANATCARMLGVDNACDAIGRSVLEFIAEESIADVRRRIDTGFEGVYEVYAKRTDGRKLRLEVAARSITFDGRPARITALRDVTDQRALEEQFRQAQKMEAIGRLAGGVAHDFNNLLTVITGHAEILSMDMTAGDSRSESVSQIRTAADAAAGLTRQLLAFSRQQVIEPRTIALGEVVVSAQKMISHLIGEDIEVTTLLAAKPCNVHIDPGQLEQVIMNLAVNARDAMPLGGNLTIETSIVEVPDERAKANWPAMPGRFARLALTDNGVGMDATTQERLFEPFFTTKEPGKGTGLGLATVYGIVHQNQGFISVYSEPGIGTTFKVYLPLSGEPPVPELDRSRFQAPAIGTETILLVEDAVPVRNLARRILLRHGYTVLDSTSPSDALELARQTGRIELLLTDVVMPEMSGRVLAEQFTALHPKGKVLFMSGYTDDTVVRNGVLSSEMPYLQKPFTPHGLATKVRHVLDAG
jgi:two-component system cell cycle sensor histidine kinase/response regulator CckA